MRKLLSFIMIFVFAFTIANAQFKVMFVDDDNNGAEATPIVDALTEWGGIYGTFTTGVAGQDTLPPVYADIQDYDMVIWYTGNDGITTLWDVSDTTGVGAGAIKFNDAITQFVAAGGILWIDGLDFVYDIYGSAPDDFAAGDFVYDVLGISQYLSQSKADDGGTGVSQMDKSTSNVITTVNPITWTYATLWFADGYAINDNAVALYEMGPSGYALEGQVSAFYYNNIITSSLRIAKLSTPEDINTLVNEMITAAVNGSFNVAVENLKNNGLVKLFPNPVSDIATISLSNNANDSEVSIFDIAGKLVYNLKVKAGQNAIINTSNFASGLYTVTVLSNNTISSTKMSVVK